MKTTKSLEDVLKEQKSCEPMAGPFGWMIILRKHSDDAYFAALKEGKREGYRRAMVKAAAVALSAIEFFDQQNERPA